VDLVTGPVIVRHAHVELALHPLVEGQGRSLLLVHGLGERTPAAPPVHLASWPGPVWGLDLTGHGASTRPVGGGYTAEVLMGDVDAALGHLGGATLLGRGLGAYVALLAAGARPDLVHGAVLADGPGLAGGGPAPHSPVGVAPIDPAPVVAAGSDGDPAALAPDPNALRELAGDVRPPDYASTFARLAVQFSALDEPVTVAAVVRPPWLAAVVAEPGVVEADVATALARYSAGR